MTSTGAGSTPRIVVGIDGSKPSITALRWAVRQAELTGFSLDVLMAWRWPAGFGLDIALPSEYDPEGDAKQILDGAIEDQLKAHPDVAMIPTLVEGHPSLNLVKASEGAELLVLGSHGHREIAGILLGSVSEYCTTHARCTVVVVRDGD